MVGVKRELIVLIWTALISNWFKHLFTCLAVLQVLSCNVFVVYTLPIFSVDVFLLAGLPAFLIYAS